MTSPEPPTGIHHEPSATPQAEPRRANLAWVIPVVAIVGLALFGAGWLSGSAYTRNQNTKAASGAPASAAATVDPYASLDGAEIGVPDEEAPETTPPAGPTLAAKDITLTPKVTEKNCFGSAGCNVTVKVAMSYNGPALAEEDTFTVTYHLTGDENGPIIGTFEVTGPSYTQDEQSLSTKSSGTKITAKVTSVEKVG